MVQQTEARDPLNRGAPLLFAPNGWPRGEDETLSAREEQLDAGLVHARLL